ncbi:MAG: tRNA (adenosine(37)-N6)-threonylcarbamoyltransferase complex ATPase subunit type 1 TsaE [Dehalococcoidia bacterium]|nr:tRNA (adenosine(37)-N6)-threonylcarbamoyltransferase complex ATPase subunit type 1 TsaE [Dehalococcoidia bacterium]
MESLKLVTHAPEETRELGRNIGKLAMSGDIYLLVGNLGTGKTCLTQGIAWGLGIEEYTLSPSFVIMREMQGRLRLYHMDFYRLDNIAEISDLGLDDYLYGRGVCVIEWAEKGMDILPGDHLLVRFSYISDTARALELLPRGGRYMKLLAELRQNIASQGKV